MRAPRDIEQALAELRAAVHAPDELRLLPLLDLALAVVRGDTSIDRDRLVQGAAPHVAAAERAVAACVSTLEHRLMCTFYGDEWVWVCENRSRIEALRTLWPEPIARLFPLYFDIETVDDLLRQKGAHEGGLRDDQIPKGTPTSHVWWWLPGEPPHP